jgi:energy-coupling factor transporter ATP-binding protein EcfA2
VFLVQVQLERFKRLNNCDMALGPVTTLIGGNNSGKTSVLQGIHFALSALNYIQTEEPVDRSTNTFRIQPNDLPYSPQADTSGAAHGGELGATPSKAIKITLHGQRDRSLAIEVSKGRGANLRIKVTGDNFVASDSDSANGSTEDAEHQGLRSVYVPGLSGVPAAEEYRSLGSCKKLIARGDSNLVLRSVLWHLKQDDTAWSNFTEDLASVFPDVEISPRFNPLKDDRVKVFYDTSEEQDLPLDSAGVGLVKTLQILSYRHLFKPDILLLDEPDAHLSPDRQRRLCALIESLTNDGTQVLLSTHSRHMLDELRHRSHVIWMREGSTAPIDDERELDVLLDLGALDSTEHFAQKSLRCVVATEDTKRIPVLTLLESNGFELKETLVLPYHGCANFNAVRILQEFLKDVAPQVSLIVHRDRDYLSSDEINRFVSLCQKQQIICFVTVPTSVEGYFLSPEHLCNHNDVSVEAATQCVADATVKCRDSDIERIFQSDLANGADVTARKSDASRMYCEDPQNWRHAKKVLGITKSLIQKAQKRNPVVFKASPHLVEPVLQQIAEILWPPA